MQRTDLNEQLPEAKVSKGRDISKLWIIPVLAAISVAWLVYSSFSQKGPTITVAFENGQGIEINRTPLKLRGVQIGKVTNLRLDENQQRVLVEVTLIQSAADIAREGSEFWIVDAEIRGVSITGLRTLVAGAYMEVRPGKGAKQTEFVAREDAPVQAYSDETLKIILLTTEANALKKGVPITYRGVQVGHVTSVQLAPDSRTVEVTGEIELRYAALVRMTSKFWEVSGIQADLGLFGARIETGTLESILNGAISFATPSASDDLAPNGTVFRLYPGGQDEWKQWNPEIQLKERVAK